MIFVFGSNLQGIHGAGAALHAKHNYGAVQGVGVGRMGNAYAIPTKSTPWKQLPLETIFSYVSVFIDYAKTHPELEFQVTRVGCGLAGYTDSQIAPMFKGSPVNCHLSEEWIDFIAEDS